MKPLVIRELGLGKWNRWRTKVQNKESIKPDTIEIEPVKKTNETTVSKVTKQIKPTPSKTISLVELAKEVANCHNCKLSKTRTNTVFSRGSSKVGSTMIIGEGPGEEEDLQGKPFVGRGGQLLDNILASIGLDESNVYIANIVKCRPPDNRNPEAEEIKACFSYLKQQISKVQPKLIIAVGKVAANTLLENDKQMKELRNKIHSFEDTPLIVFYHPAYLLRSPSNKSKTWDDLLFVRRTLGLA